MRRNLTLEDLGSFLDEPRVAVLATLRRDGTVLLSPVWHEWRDGGFNVVTGSSDVKANHLRRNPGASIVVCEDVPPYRGVELRCCVLLSAAGVHAAVSRIASRYLGPEAGAAYAARGGDDLLVRLEPGVLRAWDFADEYSAAP